VAVLKSLPRILSILVLGLILSLNGSVLGWCSATNSVLLGTSDCSAIASQDQHQCESCQHDCSEQEQTDGKLPCNEVLQLDLEDFLLFERLDSQGNEIEFDQPQANWRQRVVAVTSSFRGSHRYWVPPPIRHQFCVYQL